jgi:hypothetical protein
MAWIWENADKLGALATVATATIAVIALIFAAKQIAAGKASQREATAKDIYRDYLKLAFEHPDFAYPGERDLKQDNEYRWFVAFMLNSCDEITECLPGNELWRKTILEDLRLHTDYLNSRQFSEIGGWSMFSSGLKNIFAEALIPKRSS